MSDGGTDLMLRYALRCGRAQHRGWEVAPDAVDASVEQELMFLSLIATIDPPRRSPLCRRPCQERRRRPMIITGDHPGTATVIAAQLGMATDGKVATGAENENMPEIANADN